MRNSNDSLVSATATLRKPRPIGMAQYSCLNQQPRSIMFLSQATVLDVTQTLDNPFPPWPRLMVWKYICAYVDLSSKR